MKMYIFNLKRSYCINFLIMMHFCFRRFIFTFANSADPDEMPYNAAFYLGLHCSANKCLQVSRMKRLSQLLFYNYY